MSRLTRMAALLALVVYGLASLHCFLEGVPGFDFLKTCCFVDTAPPAPPEGDRETCVVERGDYRSEEQTVSVPQPLLLSARLSLVNEAPLPESPIPSLVAPDSPPVFPKAWQFSQRTALPPRAPSQAS